VIPIHNLYYLLCYAWHHLDEGRVVDVNAVPASTLQDLFARVLVSGTKRVLRDGLYRGYIDTSIDTQSPRGKISLTESIKRNLISRGAVACAVDDFTHDILHNRILKASIGALRKTKDLSPDLKHELAQLQKRLRDVSDVAVSTPLFRNVQLHRNNRFYRFLMNVCELVHRSLLPETQDGSYRFRDFTRDEVAMRRVFQDFVVNFYRAEQSAFRVSRDRIDWDAEPVDDASRDVLPGMETDVVLRNAARTIVIDTKYTPKALTERFGKSSIRSEHLYQLFAYLKNLERRGGADRHAEGVLLYPVVDQQHDYRYNAQGHQVSVRTVDLGKPINSIREDLLALIR
jgi:5-methylcytosine-specific restriction enzyme subunit McrC